MANFLLLYSGGGMAATDADRAKLMQAWGAWFGKLGPAVVDGGNPFSGHAKSVAKDGKIAEGDGGMKHTGYSILKADSLAAAAEEHRLRVELDGGHPSGERFGHAADQGGLGRPEQDVLPAIVAVRVHRAPEGRKHAGDRLRLVQDQAAAALAFECEPGIAVKPLGGARVFEIEVFVIRKSGARKRGLAHLPGAENGHDGELRCRAAEDRGGEALVHNLHIRS